MTVDRWMTRTVHTASSNGSLVEAFEIMRDYRVRHVPIVDGGRLVGILSDRDLRTALPSIGQVRAGDSVTRALLVRRIEEVMTTLPITIAEQASIRTAAEIMCREKVSALPVVTDGRLAGIITAEDLLWALVELL
jgi:acetoin utilization protein AcuB